MATVEQSLYNIAVALEVIAEELKTMNDSKLAVQEYEAKIQELAEKYAKDWHKDCDYPEEILKHTIKATKTTFLAGYKAAQQWISVKDRLPAPQEEVLWWNKAAHQAGVSSYEYMPHCNDTMIEWGDAGNVSIKNFTHWMPLPAAPKEDK